MTGPGLARRTEGSYGIVLPWVMLLLLGVVVPSGFILATPGKPSANFALTWALVAWATLRLLQEGLRGRRRLTLLCAYTFVYVFLGVQPLVSVWTGIFPYEPALSQGEVLRTLLIVAAGLVAMELGYRVLREVKGSRFEAVVTNKQEEESPPVWLTMLWIGIGVAMVLTIASMRTYGAGLYLGIRGGGLGFATTQQSLSQAEWLLAVNVVRTLLAALMFISMFLWVTRHRYSWRKGQQLKLHFTLGFLILVNLIISNPLSAPRLWSGALLVTMVFIAARWKGGRSYLTWATLACLGLLMLFAGFDPRRIIAQPLLAGEQVTITSTAKIIGTSIQSIQGDANFDAFQMIGTSLRYAEANGYSLGHQLLLPALFWIPRSIWPSKPISSADTVAIWLGLASTNVGSPLWAEAYVNFGILGVIAFLGIYGFCARVADDFLASTSRSPGPLVPTVLSSFFAANTFILLRGDLTTGTMYLQMIIGVTIALYQFTRRYRPRQNLPVGHVGSETPLPTG